MLALMKALAVLRSGVSCSNGDGTLAGVRWDAPLPDGFAPPTQDEVDAEIARQADPVPPFVRSGQLILALAEVGKLDAVDAVVAQTGGLAERLWQRASRFDRDNQMLIDAGRAAGMSDANIDELFRLAATK